MIFIVIPVFNRLHFTHKCIESLLCQNFKNFKVVVIDHGSTDGTEAFIRKNYPDVILLLGDKSMWWTKATNIGVNYALNNGATYILTLNNDLIVKSDYLQIIYELALQNTNAIIGSVSLNFENHNQVVYAGTIWNEYTAKYLQHPASFITYNELLDKFNFIESDLLPGRGTLIPSDVFRKIGLFDEKLFPHYMADEDFALKARRLGYKLLVSTKSPVFSHINETGLLNIYNNCNKIIYLYKSFTSIKSPNNLKNRWNWSKNSKFPIFYFLLDISRISISIIFKSFN